MGSFCGVIVHLLYIIGIMNCCTYNVSAIQYSYMCTCSCELKVKCVIVRDSACGIILIVSLF